MTKLDSPWGGPRLWLFLISFSLIAGATPRVVRADFVAAPAGSAVPTDCARQLDRALAAQVHVDIFGGKPRGSLGDLATGIWMGRLMSRAYPGVSIRILVPESIREQFARLVPQIRSSNVFVDADGVQYVAVGLRPSSPSDVFFAFSVQRHNPNAATYAKDLELPSDIIRDPTAIKEIHALNTAKLTVELDELYGGEKTVHDVSQTSEGTYVRMNTGLRSGGVYASAEERTPPCSRAQLFAKLGLSLGLSEDADARLAFSYGHHGDWHERYRVFLVTYALRHPEEKIVWVTSDAQSFEPQPQNLIIARSVLDLADSEAVVSHADLPILVTGDVSMSMAIEYGKPFFYEVQSWKRAVANDLSERISAFGNAELAALLDLAENHDTQQEFVDALYAIKRERSLVTTLGPFLERSRINRWTARARDHASLLEVHTQRQGVRREMQTFWSHRTFFERVRSAVLESLFPYAAR